MARFARHAKTAAWIFSSTGPDLAMARHTGFQNLTEAEFLARANTHVDVLNTATAGIDLARIRMHLCWGNYEGRHDHDIDLAKILPIVLRARPSAILFEAANPITAMSWQVGAKADITPDKVLAPGAITITANYVEHPEHLVTEVELGRGVELGQVLNEPVLLRVPEVVDVVLFGLGRGQGPSDQLGEVGPV